VFPCKCRIFRGYEASFLFCNVNCVHYVIYWAKGVAFIYDVLSELGSVLRIFVVIVMLVESHVEQSASLADILLVACGTFELVYSIHVIFILFLSFMRIQKFAQIVVGSIGHFYVGISEEFSDVPCFTSSVCKFGPSFLSVVLLLFYFVVVNSA